MNCVGFKVVYDTSIYKCVVFCGFPKETIEFKILS